MDLTLATAKLRSSVGRRSYWQARYKDGKIVSEWDIDWSLLPRKGLVEVRLVCPNGEVAVLGNPVDASDRVFQFKSAVARAGASTETMAHVIGIITSTNGDCKCAAWEPVPGRLVTFDDNVWDMKYQNVGQLAFAHVGVKPD